MGKEILVQYWML